MSWLPKNYDKVALGVSAIVVAAAVYSLSSGSAIVPAPKDVTPNQEVEIAQRELLKNAELRFLTDFAIKPNKVDGIEVQSFVSFPLYSIRGKEEIIPLTDEYEIHPGMPLQWWKKFGLEDYRLKGAPELDSDKDGFNNREEYDGTTNPTDKKSHPNFIAKLKATGAKGIEYELNWTMVDDKQGNFSFKGNKIRFFGSLGVGDTFPPKTADPLMTNRFEIMERGQDPDTSGEKGMFFLLQDNGALQNKKQFKLFYGSKTKITDWSASLLLGIDGSIPFNVSEGASFSLPFDGNSKEKPYLFKSKKENKAEIEYEVDGKKVTTEIEIPATK